MYVMCNDIGKRERELPVDEIIIRNFFQDERPEYPQKIIKTEVLNNPFPDIVPRLKIENEISKEDLKRGRKKKGTRYVCKTDRLL